MENKYLVCPNAGISGDQHIIYMFTFGGPAEELFPFYIDPSIDPSSSRNIYVSMSLILIGYVNGLSPVPHYINKCWQLSRLLTETTFGWTWI